MVRDGLSRERLLNGFLRTSTVNVGGDCRRGQWLLGHDSISELVAKMQQDGQWVEMVRVALQRMRDGGWLKVAGSGLNWLELGGAKCKALRCCAWSVLRLAPAS